MPISSLDECYRLLNINKNSTEAEIKRAYHLQMLKHHPDSIQKRDHRSATVQELAYAQDINQAYLNLTIPELRNKLPEYTASTVEPVAASNETDEQLIPIMQLIINAAFAKDMNALNALLADFKQLPDKERNECQSKLNWLLIEAAAAKENVIAIFLLEFGADPNHYGEYIKVRVGEAQRSFNCFFVDMLLHMDNFPLYEMLESKIDLSIYCISIYKSANKLNSSIAVNDPEGSLNSDFYSICLRRLMWSAMFCHWVLINNRPDILQQIETLMHNRYSLTWSQMQSVDYLSLFSDKIISLMFHKQNDTLRIIKKFEATQRCTNLNHFMSRAQLLLDSRITGYSGLCTIWMRLSDFSYFNEQLNVVPNGKEAQEKIFNFINHMQYFFSFLFFGGLNLFAFTGSEPEDCTGYYAFMQDCNPLHHILFLIFLSLLAVAVALMLLDTVVLQAAIPILMRILTLGNLEIFGRIDTVVLRSTVNLLLNDYAKAIIDSSPTQRTFCCMYQNYKNRMRAEEINQEQSDYSNSGFAYHMV